MKNTFLLFLISIIWGFAFLFQKTAMENIGPIFFNGLRFFLGTISLLPFVFFKFMKKNKAQKKQILFYGALLGIVLSLSSSLQQLGLFYTNVNKSAFITSMYICFVPILGLFYKRKTKFHQIASILLAVVGFYFLTITDKFVLGIEDSILIISSVGWALHIMLVDNFIRKIDEPMALAFVQFFFTAVFSFLAALIFEETALPQIRAVLVEVLFTGILSITIAFTLQIKVQKLVHPVYASLIFSTEAIFASFFAYHFLAEKITSRELFGCFLIFVAIIACQVHPREIYTFLKNKYRKLKD
jgi:drug/metabolite transporter (DMT)-like permease